MNPMAASRTATGTGVEMGGAHLQAARQFLLQAQGADGGWGYRPGQSSAAEPTGLALLASAGSSTAIARAAAWLVASWPADRRLLWNPLWWLLGRRINPQNPRLSGWSWTPGTASWVEPTSVSMLFLTGLSAELRPAGTERRVTLARAMLRDRMCPSGGWNSGNPRVYGVEGIPQAGPTAWALLALAGAPDSASVERSLAWLETHGLEFGGISSLALSCLALRAWGRPTVAFEQRIADRCAGEGWLHSVVAAAQVVLALAGASFARGRSEAVG